MSDMNCEITQSTPVEFNSARKLAFDKRFSSIRAQVVADDPAFE